MGKINLDKKYAKLIKSKINRMARSRDPLSNALDKSLNASNLIETIHKKIKKIISMTIKEAKQRKVSKSTLWEMKERLKKDPNNFNWKTKAVRKILF